MRPLSPVQIEHLHHALRALHARCEASFSGVRLAVCPDLPFDGLAYGRLIAVRQALLDRPPGELLAALVHEFAHVQQQRAGRVPPTGHTAGFAYNDDPVLEVEAEIVADTVRSGGRVCLPAPSAPPAIPVVQPLISVARQPRAAAADFSANFRRLLNLIPAGASWLDWALRSPSTELVCASERQLLTAIQLGLHGAPYMSFQNLGLCLSPSLLIDLDDASFGNVVGGLETAQLPAAALSALAALGVRTENDFAALNGVLGQIGASGALTLKGLDLAAQVALYDEFMADQPAATADQAGAAARFAVAFAQSPLELASLYAFYLALAAAPDFSAALPATVYTQLSRLAVPYLRSPSLDPATVDDDLADQIRRTLGASPLVGFATLAAAVRSFAADAGLVFNPAPADSAVADRIHRYLIGLGSVVQATATASTPVIRHLQDGLTRWIDFANEHGRARLQVDPSGQLTIQSFVPASSTAT